MLSDPFSQLDSDENLNKYKKAGEIAVRALDKVIKMTISGARVYDMCTFGDKFINDEVQKVYPELKKSRKGIAVPTNIGINNIVGAFAPYDRDPTIIKNGDLVKIELGVHIDGFPAVVAYTVIVGDTDNKEIHKVVKAVSEAGKNILKIMKPGKYNTDVIDILQNAAKKYNCQLPIINSNIYAPGVLSYQMSRFVLDGYNEDDDEFPHACILSRHSDSYGFSMNKIKLEKDEVYAMDIVMASKSGRLNPSNKVTTLYRLVPDNRANLVLKSSRKVRQSFRNYRFIQNMANKIKYEKNYRFGIRECVKKRIVEPYHVIEGSNNEWIARLKFTVIVRDNPILITGRSMNEQLSKLK